MSLFLNECLRKMLGRGDVIQAISFVVIYSSIGKYDEAIAYAQKALHIQRDVLSLEDEGTATSLYYLGAMYHFKGKITKALS